MWGVAVAKKVQPVSCFEGGVELDPRVPHILIDQCPMNTTTSEQQGRAIVRIPFAWDVKVAERLHGWLLSPPAQLLLAEISLGYRCEMMWSGDCRGYWSEQAWEALLAIKRVVDQWSTGNELTTKG